ncbi:hypothetical protein MCOR25_007471 [Pyricularia grisea]|nr:hypothetical protein MCOR25_007471 [Pyricularia grisea]
MSTSQLPQNGTVGELPSNGTAGGLPPSAEAGPPPGFSGPPPGVLGPCNFGENLGPKAERVSWTLMAFTTIFLLLRLYCKWKKSKSLWWDDWLLILAYMMYIVAAAVFSANVNHGMGLHVCELAVTRPQEISTVALLSLVDGAVSIMATIWSKTSFAFTLLRIAEKKWLKITLWTIIVILNVSMSISAVLTIVQCSPVQKSWDIFIDGYCWREAFSSYSVASAVYSGFTDIALALLPWTIILNLQMKLVEKIGIAVAMSAGIIAGAASFVKASHIPELLQGDFSYVGYYLAVWSAAEVALTIMAACVPVLRVLVRDVKNASKRYYGRSKDSGASNHTSRGTTIRSKGRSEPSSNSTRRLNITNDRQQHTNDQHHQYQQSQQLKKSPIYQHEHEHEKEQKQEQEQEYELDYLSMWQPPRLSIASYAGVRRSQHNTDLSDNWSQRNILNSDSEAGNHFEENNTYMTAEFNFEPRRPRRLAPGPPNPWPLRKFEIDSEATSKSQMGSGRSGMSGRSSASRPY